MMNQKLQAVLNHEEKNYLLPFFWQHGEDETTLRHYMNVIHDANIGAVCIESRPHPDFCGEQWWRDLDIILDEAKKLNMKVWILDDSHFPTGFANGAMASQPDELCRQSLTCRMYEVKGGECLNLGQKELSHPAEYKKNLAEQYIMNAPDRVFDDDRLFAVCARNEESGEEADLLNLVHDNTLVWNVPEGNWTVFVLHLTRNYGYHRSYINMMDARSCRILIDAVYEPHYEHYKDEFGKTIAGFFSDEPEIGNGHLYDTNDPYGSPDMDYPWSAELEEILNRKLGEKAGNCLSLLWDSKADAEKTARLRYLYMDAVTELVKKDFSMQIGTWCREHGVEYIGHLIEDDNHHSRTGSSLGHYFRGLYGQDMAGIDDIGGQVLPQQEDVSYYMNVFAHRNGQFYHYLLGKLADSAASLQPEKHGNTMCEIFGNYGWEAGVRLEKYLVDHFLIRGINHFVPHAFSPKAYPDPDCPPHFYANGNNPQYRHFGALMAYTNRICALMNDGRHVSPAAVLYHGEGDWTGKYMTDDEVCHPLLDAQIDYDIVPQDVFMDPDAYRLKIADGEFRINTQSYRTLIIPKTQFISSALANGIQKLMDEGIPVFYVNEKPEGVFEGNAVIPKAQVISLNEVVNTLRMHHVEELCITPENSRIRYRHYVHEDGCEIYMFVNEGTEVYKGSVKIEGCAYESVCFYDAWNNTLSSPVEFSGTMDLIITPLHSVIAVFGCGAEGKETEEKKYSSRTEAVFEKKWTRSVCRSIDYPCFKDSKEVSIPDHLEEEMPKFSGYVKYENTFKANKDDVMHLEISDAHEGVEVFLNGNSLGIQIVPPFAYDLSKALKEGLNTIVIEVATTLERENSGIPDVTGQIKEPQSQSGISGTLSLYRLHE